MNKIVKKKGKNAPISNGVKLLCTGSHGLVGSEAVKFFAEKGWQVYGIDNDMRGTMFGVDASTASTGRKLTKKYKNYLWLGGKDIRSEKEIAEVFRSVGPFDLIIHAAAQPSHEFSISNTITDFDINAKGTVVMLQSYRLHSPKAVFVQVSSSKVYGDSVNELPLKEYKARYDLPKGHKYYQGVDEEFGRLDGNLHSLFGASKACGDIMAKEFGTYFKLPVGIFRPVCVSGPAHKGAKLHGYLAYLVKCVAEGIPYTINGYKGKQVRDNIHSFDLIQAFWEFYKKPSGCGVTYNIGAGRESNNSILEAIYQAEKLLGKKAKIKYSRKTRRGDHLWCIYSASKFRRDYPNWKITHNNDKLMKDLCKVYKSSR